MTETPTASAAGDLDVRHADQTPPQQPPAPAVAPPTGVPWRDDTGFLHANLSPATLATARKDWMDTFDRGARDVRWNGGDQSAYTPETRAAWAAKFDAAALADNHAPVETPLQAVLDRYERAMLPYEQPRPDEYTPRFSGPVRELPTERLDGVLNATRGLASELRLLPSLGTAVIEHISEVAPQLNQMTPEGRAAWLDQQQQLGERMAGSEERFAEMKDHARQLLGTAKGSELARDLLNSSVPVLDSAWLVVTLANHSKALEAVRPRQ